MFKMNRFQREPCRFLVQVQEQKQGKGVLLPPLSEQKIFFPLRAEAISGGKESFMGGYEKAGF